MFKDALCMQECFCVMDSLCFKGMIKEYLGVKCRFCIEECPSMPTLTSLLEVAMVSCDCDASLKVHHLVVKMMMMMLRMTIMKTSLRDSKEKSIL